MGKESVFLNWVCFLEMNVDLRLPTSQSKSFQVVWDCESLRQALVPRQRQEAQTRVPADVGVGELNSTDGLDWLPSHPLTAIPHLSDIVHDPPLALCPRVSSPEGFHLASYHGPLLRYLPYLRLDHTERFVVKPIWPDVKAEGLLELSSWVFTIFSFERVPFQTKEKKSFPSPLLLKRTRGPCQQCPLILHCQLSCQRSKGQTAFENTKGSAGTWTELVPSWMVYSFPTADVTNDHRQGWLQWWKLILSQLTRPEVHNAGVWGLAPPLWARGRVCPLPLPQLLVTTGNRQHSWLKAANPSFSCLHGHMLSLLWVLSPSTPCVTWENSSVRPT